MPTKRHKQGSAATDIAEEGVCDEEGKYGGQGQSQQDGMDGLDGGDGEREEGSRPMSLDGAARAYIREEVEKYKAKVKQREPGLPRKISPPDLALADFKHLTLPELFFWLPEVWGDRVRLPKYRGHISLPCGDAECAGTCQANGNWR